MILLIFVRKGCCICDTLKNNLRKVEIHKIYPYLTIEEIDIDRFDLYQDTFKKYDYEVPILALKKHSSDQIHELPRISPRLKDNQLSNILQKNINKITDSINKL